MISANGRNVVYYSSSSDLVENDTNQTVDVFVTDIKKRITTLVSVNREGEDGGHNRSQYPAISGNGRYVTFSSFASDLVENDANQSGDVFNRDLKRQTTTLISLNREGDDSGNGFSGLPVISTNGRYVTFTGGASDLVAIDTNGNADVFLGKTVSERKRVKTALGIFYVC